MLAKLLIQTNKCKQIDGRNMKTCKQMLKTELLFVCQQQKMQVDNILKYTRAKKKNIYIVLLLMVYNLINK